MQFFYYPLLLNLPDVVPLEAIGLLHTAHFLNRGDNQGIRGGIAPEFCHEAIRAFGGLHGVRIVGEPAIIQQRLRAEFHSVHQEYNLVGIVGIGD